MTTSNDITHKNILAIKQHSEKTREMYRELETKSSAIEALEQRVVQLESQLKAIQVKLYSGGSTT